ncbi:hypothetical protein I4U23_017410 [Adineta vaga]|nr:hypothetical protein I4U23_017410 [Adineta vaga]
MSTTTKTASKILKNSQVFAFDGNSDAINECLRRHLRKLEKAVIEAKRSIRRPTPPVSPLNRLSVSMTSLLLVSTPPPMVPSPSPTLPPPPTTTTVSIFLPVVVPPSPRVHLPPSPTVLPPSPSTVHQPTTVNAGTSDEIQLICSISRVISSLLICLQTLTIN